MAGSGFFGSLDGRKKYAELFKPENQPSVRADLKTFFGPRADIFLNTYDKICAKSVDGKPNFAVYTWCWPAFLIMFVWYFYRKMYLIGAMIILLPVILGFVFGSAGGGGIQIVMTMFAKMFYVQTGLGRILKADKLGLTGEKRTDYLQRAGGVSLPAGIFSGIIFAAVVTFAFVEIIQKFQGN